MFGSPPPSRRWSLRRLGLGLVVCAAILLLERAGCVRLPEPGAKRERPRTGWQRHP